MFLDFLSVLSVNAQYWHESAGLTCKRVSEEIQVTIGVKQEVPM